MQKRATNSNCIRRRHYGCYNAVVGTCCCTSGASCCPQYQAVRSRHVHHERSAPRTTSRWLQQSLTDCKRATFERARQHHALQVVICPRRNCNGRCICDTIGSNSAKSTRPQLVAISGRHIHDSKLALSNVARKGHTSTVLWGCARSSSSHSHQQVIGSHRSQAVIMAFKATQRCHPQWRRGTIIDSDDKAVTTTPSRKCNRQISAKQHGACLNGCVSHDKVHVVTCCCRCKQIVRARR